MFFLIPIFIQQTILTHSFTTCLLLQLEILRQRLLENVIVIAVDVIDNPLSRVKDIVLVKVHHEGAVIAVCIDNINNLDIVIIRAFLRRVLVCMVFRANNFLLIRNWFSLLVIYANHDHTKTHLSCICLNRSL